MKLLIVSLTLAIACLSHSQDMTEQICKLYDEGQYKVVTNTYGNQQSSLTYKGLFYVGLAYYKQGKDQTAIDIMDKCISRNKKDSGPHYIKGKALYFMKLHGKAVKSFEKAIALAEGNGNYYTSLGDAYMSMNQLDKALTAYQSAIKYDDCPERPYHKIPLILTATGKNQPALEAYYTAKEHVDPSSDKYSSILYKIALHESMNQDFFDAKIVLEELIALEPTFYRAYPLLIQSNIRLRKFEEIEPLRNKLYDAYDNGLLADGLNEKFCFDQFVWENSLDVKAYERFDSEKDKSYVKHVYEVAKENTRLYTIETKHQPESGNQLILHKNMGEEDITYDIQFNTNNSYKDLRTAVIKVIADKIEPLGQ